MLKMYTEDSRTSDATKRRRRRRGGGDDVYKRKLLGITNRQIRARNALQNLSVTLEPGRIVDLLTLVGVLVSFYFVLKLAADTVKSYKNIYVDMILKEAVDIEIWPTHPFIHNKPENKEGDDEADEGRENEDDEVVFVGMSDTSLTVDKLIDADKTALYRFCMLFYGRKATDLSLPESTHSYLKQQLLFGYGRACEFHTALYAYATKMFHGYRDKTKKLEQLAIYNKANSRNGTHVDYTTTKAREDPDMQARIRLLYKFVRRAIVRNFAIEVMLRLLAGQIAHEPETNDNTWHSRVFHQAREIRTRLLIALDSFHLFTGKNKDNNAIKAFVALASVRDMTRNLLTAKTVKVEES